MTPRWQRPCAALCVVAALIGPGATGDVHADRARARALVEQGDERAAAGELDAAVALYQRALAADADYLPAYEAAAPLWFSRGEHERAARELERATLRHPRFAFGWYALAYAYRRLDRPALAITAYESFLALRPRDAAGHYGLAVASLQAGRAETARRAFERYLELETDPARASFVARARRELAALESPGVCAAAALLGRVVPPLSAAASRSCAWSTTTTEGAHR
jgi:tetratricopeptide (TPR) repeat protein